MRYVVGENLETHRVVIAHAEKIVEWKADGGMFVTESGKTYAFISEHATYTDASDAVSRGVYNRRP